MRPQIPMKNVENGFVFSLEDLPEIFVKVFTKWEKF